MSKKKILAMVIAGGEGSRLHPLTAERSKPSVRRKHRVQKALNFRGVRIRADGNAHVVKCALQFKCRG